MKLLVVAAALAALVISTSALAKNGGGPSGHSGPGWRTATFLSWTVVGLRSWTLLATDSSWIYLDLRMSGC